MAQLARAGDESAFAEIVRRYSPRVFRFASKFFRQRSVVEEAAQEVFMKAFTQLGSFEGRGSMEGWLTRITTNTCLNMLRSNQLSEVAAERHRSSERSFVAADLADRVLENLSSDDRMVLTLIDGEDASVKEVAELTGWSESKVKVQAFRARRRMRAAVEKLLGKQLPPAVAGR